MDIKQQILTVHAPMAYLFGLTTLNKWPVKSTCCDNAIINKNAQQGNNSID